MSKRSPLQLLLTAIVAIIVIIGLYAGWQAYQRNKKQTDFVKSANSSYKDDARYISFGPNYIFAVPKSYIIDESSVSGVQLVVSSGGNVKITTLDQLYEVGGVAIQPLASAVNPKDNQALKNYILQNTVPDLKKNLSQDVIVTFSRPGKYQVATIVVNKDGKKVRQIYARGGLHPFMVVSKEYSDAYKEVTNTLVDVEDFNGSSDIAAIKKIIQSGLSLLQQGKGQEFYDSGGGDLKKQIKPADVTDAINNSSSYLHRNITVLGGSLLNNQFSAQMLFPAANKDEQPSLGLFNLQKEGDSWKVWGFSLPKNK